MPEWLVVPSVQLGLQLGPSFAQFAHLIDELLKLGVVHRHARKRGGFDDAAIEVHDIAE